MSSDELFDESELRGNESVSPATSAEETAKPKRRIVRSRRKPSVKVKVKGKEATPENEEVRVKAKPAQTEVPLEEVNDLAISHPVQTVQEEDRENVPEHEERESEHEAQESQESPVAETREAESETVLEEECHGNEGQKGRNGSRGDENPRQNEREGGYQEGRGDYRGGNNRKDRFGGNNRKDRFGNNNRKDRNRNNNNNNNNRGPREELPPEVSLEEHPDTPKLYISELAKKPIEELRSLSRSMGITEEIIADCRKQDLIKEMSRLHTQNGGALLVEGTIEVLPDGYGFLRYAVNSYLSGSEDVYVPQGQVKQNGLRTGDTVYGQVRTPRDNEKVYGMYRIFSVNNDTLQNAKLRAPFDSLTPLFPDEKLHLEVVDEKGEADISTRVVDLFCPIGKGQRSLIVAPPRTGKTVLLQKIANSITKNHPEVVLIVLLVDERPEEVTDMRRHVAAEVVASTFDEQATRHVQVAEMVIEKAKRLVEAHRDVVILLDSITRLARAYNQTVPASGKILSGGVDSNALHKPKRFFGAARNIENGGSLTIISSALIETGSRMDEVIFEEFKGTGNNEIVLDRRMADSRKFPAINIKKSGTRRDDLLLTKDELARVWLLRNAVANMEDVEMSVFLIDKMKKTSNNKEFLGSLNGSAVSNATQVMSSVK